MNRTKLLLIALALLLQASPVALAQQIERPEQDPEYADMPLETEYRVECDRIYALLTHPRGGDVMLFGSKGFSGSISWPSGTSHTFDFPITDDILAAAFSSDDLLYLAGTDGIVRQFKRGSTEVQRSYPEDALWADNTIRSAEISPDDKLLATGGDSGQVRLYDLETHEELLPFEGAEDRVTTLAFSPDASLLAVGVKTGAVHLFDPRQVESSRTATLHEGSLYALAFAKDGKTLFTCGSDGKVDAVDVASLEIEKSVQVCSGPLTRLSLAASALDRPLLVVAGLDGRVWFLHGGTLEIEKELPGPRPDITALRLNEGGFFLTIAYEGGAVRSVFAYKLLRGDTVTPDWLADAEALTDAASYEEPAARIGLRLTPAAVGETKGLQVTGWLFGFPRPNEEKGIPLGSLVTHLRYDHELQPVGETLRIPEGQQFAWLAYVDPSGAEKETVLPVVSAGQARLRGEVARALAEGLPVYDVGFEVLDGGHIRRADRHLPEGLGVGSIVQEVQGRPWRKAEADWWRFRASADPISLRTDGKLGSVAVELVPEKVPEIVQLALLGAHLFQAGEVEEGEQKLGLGMETSKEDWRLYAFSLPAMSEVYPADEEMIRDLHKILEQCNRAQPVYEAMVPFVERIEGPAGVVKLLRNPVANTPECHELRFLLGDALGRLGKHQEALDALVHVVYQGDSRAYLPFARSLQAKGEGDEALAYYKMYFYGEEILDIFRDEDGKPRWPARLRAVDDPDFAAFVALARELGRD